MTLNDTATLFLQTYADGGEPADGWLYARALQQCRLDYSPESLPRLDDLLRQARERVQPSAEHLASAKGRNFTALVAFYVIEMLRRRTGAHLAWHDRDSALRTLPPGTQVPELSYTRLLIIGADQGAAFWPLSWVEAQLLPEGKRAPAQAYIDDLVALMERDAPMAWWQAAEAAGRLASRQMRALATGRPLVPALLAAAAPDEPRPLATPPATAADLQQALDAAAVRMDSNPQGDTWQVLGYEGFVADPGVRTDAVIVVVHTYGDRPLRMKLAFTYRAALPDLPFAILQTRLRQSNAPGAQLAKLQAALDRGIQSVEWPDGSSWNALRQDA